MVQRQLNSDSYQLNSLQLQGQHLKENFPKHFQGKWHSTKMWAKVSDGVTVHKNK